MARAPSNAELIAPPLIAALVAILFIAGVAGLVYVYKHRQLAKKGDYEALDMKPDARSNGSSILSVEKSGLEARQHAMEGGKHAHLPTAHVHVHGAHVHGRGHSTTTDGRSGVTLEHDPKPTPTEQLKADVSVRQPTSDTPHAPASAPALAPAPTPAAPPAALDEDPPMGAPGLGSRHAHKTLKPVSLPADKPPPAAKPAVPETPRKAMRHVAADVKYLTEIEKSAISVQVDAAHASVVQHDDGGSIEALLPRGLARQQTGLATTPRTPAGFVRQHTGLNVSTPRSPSDRKTRALSGDLARQPEGSTGGPAAPAPPQASGPGPSESE